MSRTIKLFLQKQIQKGGQNAYCALLILGAMEHGNRDLLKKFNIMTVNIILNEYKKGSTKKGVN